jgi:prepilin-type processing-associated H-X9-DG protein
MHVEDNDGSKAMRCGRCGVRNPLGVEFCLYCGQRLLPPPRSQISLHALLAAGSAGSSVSMYIWALAHEAGKRSSWYVPAALVLALAAVVIGQIATFRVRRSRGSIRGGRLATLAVVVGASTVLLGLFLPVGREALARPSRVAEGICLSNMMCLTRALGVYADNYGQLPSAPDWCEAILPDVTGPGRFTCPTETEGITGGYALNDHIRDIGRGSGLAPQTVSVFESDAGWNAAGGAELLPDVPRHSGGDNYGFADGHVEWIKRKKNPDGTWAKAPDADWVIWKPVLKETTPEGSEHEP